MMTNLSECEKPERERRMSLAVRMQKIEQNSLTEDEVAMFAIFESEDWSHERRHDYIRRYIASIITK